MRYIYGIKQNGILPNDSIDFIEQHHFPLALEVSRSTEIPLFTIHKTVSFNGRSTTYLTNQRAIADAGV